MTERSPLRVWVNYDLNGTYLYDCPACGNGESWMSRGVAISWATEHARTCTALSRALRLARLEAELEKLAEQYSDLAEFKYPGIDYLGEPREAPPHWDAVSDVYQFVHDDLTDLLVRHRGQS